VVLCFVYGRNHKSCEKVANSIGFAHGPCTRPCTSRVYGRVDGLRPSTWPCPCTRRCNGRVHGPYTTAVNTTVHTAMYTAVYTAMYTAVYGPCTRRYKAVYGYRAHTPPYTAVTHCVPAVNMAEYMAVHGPCIRLCTRIVSTAVYGPRRRVPDRVHGRVRQSTGGVHGRYNAVLQVVNTAVYGPYTRLQSRVHGTRPCTYTGRVHGRVCIHPFTRLCTWPVCGRVQSPYMAMYTVVSSVHGPYTAVTRPLDDRVRAVNTAEYAAVYRPCHGSVHGPCTDVHGPYTAVITAVYGP